MATQIKMPQLSDTMDAGKILTWHKKEGEPVARGEMLAEVETDKANLEIECFNPGILLKIVAPVGTRAKVGELIAVIGNAGEEVSLEQPQHSQSVPPPAAQVPEAPQEQAPQPAVSAETDRIKASPLAKKIAQEKNIDLSTVSGSGPDGRIVVKDLETAAPGRAKAPAAVAPVSAAGEEAAAGGTFSPLSRMRETIARRMTESSQQTPHFFVSVAIDMRSCVKLHETLKRAEEYKTLSINHLVIKAAAYALTKEKAANCAIREGKRYEPAQINIGIITAVEDGLLIPVIKNADQLNLKDIAFEAKAAVERARAGRPNSTDLTVINPGQGAALAVSSIKEEPVVEKGCVIPGLRMRVSLSADHRILDGIIAANFLRHFKQALEMPALMMM